MSPRPILKRSQNSFTAPHDHPPHHAVHFPPSPSLTRTFSAHSSSAYDRSPIVVTPNSCALPERGCPGRTYTLDDPAPSSTPSSAPARRGHPYGGRDLHPRAFAFAAANARQQQLDREVEDSEHTPTRTSPVLPSLIPDLSSESEESDGFASPTPEPYLLSPPAHLSRNHHHGLSIPPSLSSSKYSQYTPFDVYSPNGPTTPAALSFLPHPPSSPTSSHGPYPPREDDAQLLKARRRRERERKRERSRERDRIRGVAVEDDEYDVDNVVVASKSSGNKGSASYKSLSVCKALSSFSIEDPDVGCLGGF